MRHLGSLIGGIVIAPIAWVLVALGQEQSSATIGTWIHDDAFRTAELIKPICLLAAAGILLGLIATLRLSPVGALLAGVFYAGSYLALFVSPLRVHNAVPGRWHVAGQTIHLRVPLDNGTPLVLGALLLVAVVSAERWRGRRVAVETGSESADTATPAEQETTAEETTLQSARPVAG